MTDSIIAAIIAASAVIVTSMVSNFLGEAFKRHREKVSVASGLVGELCAYRENIDPAKTVFGAAKNMALGGQHLPMQKIPLQTNRFYEANISKLGMLGPQIAGDVVYVYGHIQAYMVLASMLHEAEDAKHLAGMLSMMLLSIEKAERRGDPLLDALKAIAQSKFRRSLLRP